MTTLDEFERIEAEYDFKMRGGWTPRPTHHICNRCGRGLYAPPKYQRKGVGICGACYRELIALARLAREQRERVEQTSRAGSARPVQTPEQPSDLLGGVPGTPTSERAGYGEGSVLSDSSSEGAGNWEGPAPSDPS